MILIFLKISIFSVFLCDAQSIINTLNGPVQGINKHFEEGTVTEYLGVPFAKFPYKYKRFMPPSDLGKPEWDKTFFAKNPAVTCYQYSDHFNFSGIDYLNSTNKLREDCLELNMWVPQNRSGAVLVVIFAGGFTSGSPSSDSNNGSILALKSRAIVVNVNYRLGVFGFAYLGENSKIKGNMGLLDQQMGMKWVYENIENFGGKKDMITIFGQCSGGASVTAHFLSEASKNYFKRAIVFSATIANFWATVSPKTAQENMEAVAKLLKCNGNDDEKIKCLQTVDANKLLMTSVTLHNSKLKTPKDSFLPINSDNVFFKGSVDDKLKKKQMKNDFDLLFGRDSDEGTYFMVKYLKKFGCNFDPNKHPECEDNSCRLNDTTLKDAVQILSNMVEFNENKTAELFMIYNSIKTSKTREKVAQLFSDVIINCECSLFLDSYLDITNKNVYLFEFRRQSTINPFPKWMGIRHGSELYYFFGHPFRYPYKYDRKDLQFEKKFSEKLMEELGEFAATGKPKTNWKKFTKTSKKALKIDDFYCMKNHKKYVLATSERCIKFNQLMEKRELNY